MKYHANTNKSTTVCTRCGARPGELCRSKSGRVASQWHGNREHQESVAPILRFLNEPSPSLIQRVVAFFKKVA